MASPRWIPRGSKEVPKFRQLDPCVNIRFSQPRSRVLLCARRYSSDGKTHLPDGRYVFDLVDWDIHLPVGDAKLGGLIRQGLSRSRQLGANTSGLPPSIEDVVPNTAHSGEYHFAVVWSHRDETTPYFMGASLGYGVDLDLLVLEKPATDEAIGGALQLLFSEIARGHWP